MDRTMAGGWFNARQLTAMGTSICLFLRLRSGNNVADTAVYKAAKLRFDRMVRDGDERCHLFMTLDESDAASEGPTADDGGAWRLRADFMCGLALFFNKHYSAVSRLILGIVPIQSSAENGTTDA